MVLLPALLAAGLAQTPADLAKLVVTAEGFRGTEGVALFQVYGSEESWLDKPVKVKRTRIKAGKAQVTFVGLGPGWYAVSVTHDANGNGKMDMAWLPYPHPDEGGGVSNDAEATIGPPAWKDAKVELARGGNVITVKIGYY